MPCDPSKTLHIEPLLLPFPTGFACPIQCTKASIDCTLICFRSKFMSCDRGRSSPRSDRFVGANSTITGRVELAHTITRSHSIYYSGKKRMYLHSLSFLGSRFCPWLQICQCTEGSLCACFRATKSLFLTSLNRDLK